MQGVAELRLLFFFFEQIGKADCAPKVKLLTTNERETVPVPI